MAQKKIKKIISIDRKTTDHFKPVAESDSLDLSEIEAGKVLEWRQVAYIHRSRNGIYQKNGRLVSLLTDFGRINPCYPDFNGKEGVIEYTGSGRRGNQKLDLANQALHNAIKTGDAVPLFNKLKVNSWEYLGMWSVSDAAYIFDESHHRMVWKFTLNLNALLY